MKSLRPLMILPLLLLAVACGKGGDGSSAASTGTPPEVSNARVRLAPPGGAMAAGYFDVHNPGTTVLELRAVSSPAFSSVDMHETREEGGMSRMRPIDKVEIPPGGSATFEPGGKHLMLMGLKLDADKAVQEVPMRLEFVAADGSKRIVEAPFAVEAAAEDAGGSHH